MATKQDEFKQRFAEILSDLQAEGQNDPEAMWLIGSLAADIIDRTGHKSWGAFKRDIDQDTYTGLLVDFEKEGNRLYREGDQKKAYAIQALAVSLIAPTQDDRTIKVGEQLLDALLEQTIGLYRKHPGQPRPTVN